MIAIVGRQLTFFLTPLSLSLSLSPRFLFLASVTIAIKKISKSKILEGTLIIAPGAIASAIGRCGQEVKGGEYHRDRIGLLIVIYFIISF